ncbi:hypothetical protein RA2_04230 [Roseovarius sp. A-2]|nr:hypothetical protein RA2_04230 [Roseovarius sp. A-2]
MQRGDETAVNGPTESLSSRPIGVAELAGPASPFWLSKPQGRVKMPLKYPLPEVFRMPLKIYKSEPLGR